MKPRKSGSIPQADMFRLSLEQMLNQRHALYKLAAQSVWKNIFHCYNENYRTANEYLLFASDFKMLYTPKSQLQIVHAWVVAAASVVEVQ